MNSFTKFKMNQRADSWVSSTVLVGCVLITAALVLAAMKAQVLGHNLTKNITTVEDSESI